jgi:hypothetical protein
MIHNSSRGVGKGFTIIAGDFDLIENIFQTRVYIEEMCKG